MFYNSCSNLYAGDFNIRSFFPPFIISDRKLADSIDALNPLGAAPCIYESETCIYESFEITIIRLQRPRDSGTIFSRKNQRGAIGQSPLALDNFRSAPSAHNKCSNSRVNASTLTTRGADLCSDRGEIGVCAFTEPHSRRGATAGTPSALPRMAINLRTRDLAQLKPTLTERAVVGIETAARRDLARFQLRFPARVIVSGENRSAI
jgi:hypothetical protein